jgi:hypothetical protein
MAALSTIHDVTGRRLVSLIYSTHEISMWRGQTYREGGRQNIAAFCRRKINLRITAYKIDAYNKRQ